MLQIFVLLTDPKKKEIAAFFSIAISALSTGFASAKIVLDKDLDTDGRKNQPEFYGELLSVTISLLSSSSLFDTEILTACRLHP